MNIIEFNNGSKIISVDSKEKAVRGKVRYIYMYDCSVKKGRKGCNYCLHYKPIDVKDFRVNIDDDLQVLDIENGYSREDCRVKINYCPICGKQLREEFI